MLLGGVAPLMVLEEQRESATSSAVKGLFNRSSSNRLDELANLDGSALNGPVSVEIAHLNSLAPSYLRSPNTTRSWLERLRIGNKSMVPLALWLTSLLLLPMVALHDIVMLQDDMLTDTWPTRWYSSPYASICRAGCRQ